MSDEISSLDEFDLSELSEQDLTIIRAFEAMDTWNAQEQSHCQAGEQNGAATVSPVLAPQEDEEMLLIFAAEAEEDISSMRQILNQLACHEPENVELFVILKRAGHKLQGAAGAIGFPLIATIAAQVELIAAEVSRGTISAHTGVEAISVATTALEAGLQTITAGKQELEASSLLANLDVAYRSLEIDLEQLERGQAAGEVEVRVEQPLPPPPAHVDAQRFAHLVEYTDKLAAQSATVEDALAQVACALQELDLAQTRLQRLEPLITKWQEKENEQNTLLYTFKDAIADLAITTANVQSAFVRSSMLQQDYLVGIAQLHRDTLLQVSQAHQSVLCFLVRAGEQHLLVPFQQIQRISDEQRGQTDVRYSLQELLAFRSGASPGSAADSDPTAGSGAVSRCLPLLIPGLEDGAIGGRRAGVVVDEVVGEQECVVRPLAAYLRRPGIMGAAIDGTGRVLLVVDLRALVCSRGGVQG